MNFVVGAIGEITHTNQLTIDVGFSEADPSSLSLTPLGLGPFTVGMDYSAASQAAKELGLEITTPDGGTCDMVRGPSDQWTVMIGESVLTISARQGGEGIDLRVGEPESRVLERHPNAQVERSGDFTTFVIDLDGPNTLEIRGYQDEIIYMELLDDANATYYELCA